MCFQIVDDVLDITADESRLGKPAGKDILEGVYTLPVIYALRDSPALRELLGRPDRRRRSSTGARARGARTAPSTSRSSVARRTR